MYNRINYIINFTYSINLVLISLLLISLIINVF